MIELLEHSQEWCYADLVAQPVRDCTEPTVLVRRRTSLLLGPNDEELHPFPGSPAISLFTGCGGFDLGIEKAGFCVVVQHERDRIACETLIANRPRWFPHAALIQGDIYQTPTSMILSEGGLRVGEAHLLIGGPPCQGFSSANARAVKHLPDARNDLVYQFLRVVREAQPKFFMFENVPGFIRFNKGEYLKAFLRTAYDAYYELVYALADAAEHGVPQYRCRFLCMGTRRDLAEIDGVLAAFPKAACYSKEDLKYLHVINTPLFPEDYNAFTRAPGIRYFPDRPVLVPPAPIQRRGGRSKTYIEFYARLRRDEPDRLVCEPIEQAG